MFANYTFSDLKDDLTGLVGDTDLTLDYLQSTELNNSDVNFNNVSIVKSNVTIGSGNTGLFNSSCWGFRFGITGGWMLSCEP